MKIFTFRDEIWNATSIGRVFKWERHEGGHESFYMMEVVFFDGQLSTKYRYATSKDRDEAYDEFVREWKSCGQ